MTKMKQSTKKSTNEHLNIDQCKPDWQVQSHHATSWGIIFLKPWHFAFSPLTVRGRKWDNLKVPHAYKPAKLTCTKFRTVARNANRQASHHQSDLSRRRSETCVPKVPASQGAQIFWSVKKPPHTLQLCKRLNSICGSYVM